jgi:hypothetical protein
MTSKYLFTLGLIGSGLAMAGLGQVGCSSSSNGAGGSGTTASGSGGTKTTTHTAASSTGVTTGGGGSPGAESLGLACASDTDCGGAPLTCILPTASDPVFGGGPANGYCSQTCMTDADCPSTGACLIGASGPGDCVESCTIGPALSHINDPLDPTKCQGRDDLRCTSIDSEGTVFGCLPTCGSDSQCPTGSACDPRNSVCVPSTSVSTGLPAGSACDPMATTPDCAGVCVSFTGSTPAVTLCSDDCTLGGDVTTTSNCGGLAKGLCAYSPTGNGAGDYGFCANACTAQTDCQTPNFWCFPITNLTGTGKGEVPNGWCFGATACPGGQGDCSGDMGTTCQQTAAGPVCLSTTYPLGGADGGTDSGTPDSGTPDSGTPDSGTPDAGVDSGTDDAGDGG